MKPVRPCRPRDQRCFSSRMQSNWRWMASMRRNFVPRTSATTIKAAGVVRSAGPSLQRCALLCQGFDFAPHGANRRSVFGPTAAWQRSGMAMLFLYFDDHHLSLAGARLAKETNQERHGPISCRNRDCEAVQCPRGVSLLGGKDAGGRGVHFTFLGC
jgi:hypothetical protein